MTDHQRSMLKSAGWTQVVPPLWRSPLTARDMDERAALAIISIRPRTGRPQLYSNRQRFNR